jgi:hypothetical protein
VCGGTPVQIWKDREYWGEANAMLYLRDRVTKKNEQRALFTRIIRTVELSAKKYVERFDQIAQKKVARQRLRFRPESGVKGKKRAVVANGNLKMCGLRIHFTCLTLALLTSLARAEK